MTIEKVKKIVGNQFNAPAEKIKEETRIIEDLGADSLDAVELLVAFEQEFNISISDEEANTLKTIKNIADLIDSKLKK